MKLLFISPRFSGGIGGHANMLYGQLIKNGFDIKKMEVPHIPIKNLKNPSFAIFSSLKGILSKESFDIVHGFNVPSSRTSNGFSIINFQEQKILSLNKIP